MTHRHASSDNKSQIAGIAFLSAVIGAVTALLMAPKAGDDTRKSIREHIRSLSKNVKDIDVEVKTKPTPAKRAATKASNTAKTVKSTVESTARRAADKTKV
jgi:gas vesicle protein